jgi:AraC family transcriptional regulator
MRQVEVSTKLVERGLCESPAHVDHRLSIHVGNPVGTVCREAGSRRRWVRVGGSINIVPAGAESRWLIESRMEQLLVCVPQETFVSVAEDLGLDGRAVNLDKRHEVHDDRIAHLGHALRLEAMEGTPNGPMFGDGLSVAICAQLIRGFSRRAAISPPRRVTLSPLQIARITEHIEEHLGCANLSLLRLSEVAGASLSQLRVAFKEVTGRPVHRYVVERRVERAARLLAQGTAISDAAAQSGFAHASHMARWMRRLMRVSPSQLRR